MRRRTVVVFLACGLLLGMSVFIGMTVAQPTPWKLLGHQDYQIVDVVDGRPVLFNDLRDADRRKISEYVTRLLETDPAAAEKWISETRKSQLRPDIVPPVNFYTISAGNELVRLDRDVLSVSFGDTREQERAKIARLYVDGKAALVPADPGYSFGVLSSPDHRRSVIPTSRGLWLVEPDRQVAVRISAEEYDGKIIDELESELRALRGDSPAVLWWHADPIFSPDGDTIVFTTNRDCIEGGTSVWVNHLPSGKEYALVRNTGREHEHYRVLGWVDDSYIIVAEYTGPTATRNYHLLALSGELTPLSLEGRSPYIVGIGPGGLVAYVPDVDTHPSRDLCVVRLDLGDKSVTGVHHIQMRGDLRLTRGNCPPFSPDGSKVAYVNAVDDGTARGTRILVLVDLDQHGEIVITAPTEGTVVYDFDWIDGNRLLVRMIDRKGEPGEISSWICSSSTSRVLADRKVLRWGAGQFHSGDPGSVYHRR